jgi:hypothetical protein
MSSVSKSVESLVSVSAARSIVRSVGLALGVAAVAASSVSAEDGRAWIAHTNEHGAWVTPANGPWNPDSPFTGRGVLWTYDNGFLAIPNAVSFAPTAGLLWVGQTLNNEVLQNFAVPGDGTVNDSYPAVANSAAAVSASAGADLAVMADGEEYTGPFTVRAYTSAGPTWTFDFPAPYVVGNNKSVKVSRDGSTIAVGGAYYDPNQQRVFARVYIFNADGTVRSQWDGNGGVGGVDLSDDGSVCLITNDSNGQVLNTATGAVTFTASGSGGGASFQISGNGKTIVLGGFNLTVYTESGGSWTPVINFTDRTQWFGWGSAVSRDGNTVVAITHDYGNGYLDTRTRSWDVPSRTLLGTYHTIGSGGFQDAASGAAISDDGSRFVVSSWGTQNNDHPEVMIFDRSVNLIGEVDTRGSVFTLAMTPDGRYVSSGNKGGHANSFGNGGDVTLFEVPGGCPADFNGDQFIDFFDYADYVACFEGAGCPDGTTADFNGDAFVDFFDYAEFVTAFETGC